MQFFLHKINVHSFCSIFTVHHREGRGGDFQTRKKVPYLQAVVKTIIAPLYMYIEENNRLISFYDQTTISLFFFLF